MSRGVETKIKKIKGLIVKLSENERILLLQQETLALKTANTLNAIPLALGNLTSQFENIDLLTTNQLSLGAIMTEVLLVP